MQQTVFRDQQGARVILGATPGETTSCSVAWQLCQGQSSQLSSTSGAAASTAASLASVIGPSLCRPPGSAYMSIRHKQALPKIRDVVKAMFLHAAAVFNNLHVRVVCLENWACGQLFVVFRVHRRRHPPLKRLRCHPNCLFRHQDPSAQAGPAAMTSQATKVLLISPGAAVVPSAPRSTFPKDQQGYPHRHPRLCHPPSSTSKRRT